MQYRDFGNTGVKISALGFGAMRIPFKDVDESIRVIQRAFELGINYIDTAPYYCDQQSEPIVGQALKGWRDKVYLSTKNYIKDPDGKRWRDVLEASLNKLDTNYVDFYHFWGITWDEFEKGLSKKNGPLEEALKVKEEGLIHHISFSFHDKPENMIRLINTGYFETVLCQYNLLDRSNETAIQHAKEKGVGVVVMGPVGGGRLGAPSEQISKLLPGKTSSSAEIALRFVLANPGVTCALSGMESIKMVEENVRVASNETHLSEVELQRIQVSLEENRRMSELYCTGCNYCMPCPKGINIPLNFQIMNYHRVYGLTDYAKNQYSNLGIKEPDNDQKAEECSECGVCETKCPQRLQIRKQLKETAETLGNKF